MTDCSRFVLSLLGGSLEQKTSLSRSTAAACGAEKVNCPLGFAQHCTNVSLQMRTLNINLLDRALGPQTKLIVLLPLQPLSPGVGNIWHFISSKISFLWSIRYKTWTEEFLFKYGCVYFCRSSTEQNEHEAMIIHLDVFD